MKQVTFIILLAACLYAKGEAPTNITSSVDYTCVYNESGSALSDPTLCLFTNSVFSYGGYPTNPVNVVADWPQNAQAQGYTACVTNEVGAMARGIITNLNGASQPGLDVSFTMDAQEFEIHVWDQGDEYFDIYDEDDGSLTTFQCGENDDPQWYLVQYASKKTRHLRVYFECDTGESVPGIIFNGINVGQGDSISADTNRTPGMMVEGDSYCQGFNPSTGKWFYDSYATLAGFLTNGGDFHVLADGIGGSGFLANGEGTNYAARFTTDVLPYTNLFRFFVLQASINDAAATNSSQQLYPTNLGGWYYDAVTNMIGMAQRYLPAQEIAVLGIPRDPGTQGGTNLIHNVDARNAAAAMGVPFFDAMNQLAIPAGDVGWDGVHLDQAGYQLVANYLNGQMADAFTDYPATSYYVAQTNQAPTNQIQDVSLSLSVTNFGAVGDGEAFSVNTVSNSTVVSVAGTNVFSAADIGKVIEVFGAGPWIDYSNWGPVVTQQDIICLITNVTDGTNLSLSIPCGYTMEAYCVVGTNNAPAFQAAINDATGLISGGQATNVIISIPAGTYLMVSSNVLNPNYQMISISDTHPALIISSGGITLQGQSATNTILMGCGAGMNHLVQGSLTWISPGYAPYVPMRDTLIECRGPVANNQLPLVFQNLTLDGGLTNGAQAYNYWTIIQANGEGWDTTHHAVADWDGYVTYQMNQVKEFTNCIFQHWRGEICICWTADITNALNDWENCQFLDGNATADNMYYGQKINNCVFNNVGKVMEYYQNDGYTNSSIMENCLITNISEVAGPAGVHVDCALTGAVTNRTMPSFTFFNNQFYDNVGMEFFSLNAAENVSFISNNFTGLGPVVNLTGTGQQPTDGTQVWYMTNFVFTGNSGLALSIGFSEVEDLMCSNNTGFTLSASIGYATNIVLSGNSGVNMGNDYYDVMCENNNPTPGQPSHIQSGQYPLDLTNNNWVVSTPATIDGGGVYPTNLISYGNGTVHELQASGATFYLDDSHPGMNPVGAILQVYAATWNSANVTNFYTSLSGGTRLTLTNNAPPTTFYWNGSKWSIQSQNPPVPFTASPTNGSSSLTVQFKSPSIDSSGKTIKSWQWDFGDGTTSTAQNPSHTYTNVTTFFPALSVINTLGLSSLGSGPAITTTNPAVHFTFSPSNGVARLTVHFTSPTADTGGNTIKSWYWNFGDGSTGTGQNPSHVYTNVGTYDPALTITNDHSLSATSSAVVTVTNPAVKFTATPTNACPNLTIKFSAPSVDTGGNKITSWLWNFGDGTPTSTAENPTHTYVNVQTYQPTLTVVNASDFSPNSFGPAINVAQPTVQFTPNPGNGVSRYTVAFKSPAVDSTGVSIKSWQWNFGDGTTGSGQNPTHIYTNPATYTPMLTISNSVGDLATASGTISVTNPAVKFTASSTNVCPGPSIEFKSPATDSGGNKITSWSWNFGDGTPISTTENPTHTYTTFQTYTPTLTVANVYGLSPNCSGPAINVVNPSVQFTSTPSKGVSRLTVAFKSPSVDSVGVSIKSWHWNFGDGTTGSGQNPTHIYTNPATYLPVLTISNAVAYWATNFGSVTVTNPAIKFTASTNTGFSPLTIVFKAPAVDSGNNKVTNWVWNFGDNTTSTAENPTHIYTSIQTYYPSVSSKNVYGLTPTSLGPVIIVETTASGVQISGSSPLLSATLSNGALVLSWPTNASGYTLQFSTNLMPPVSWINVTSPTVIVNGQNVVTNAVTDPEMFFRLEQ